MNSKERHNKRIEMKLLIQKRKIDSYIKNINRIKKLMIQILNRAK